MLVLMDKKDTEFNTAALKEIKEIQDCLKNAEKAIVSMIEIGVKYPKARYVRIEAYLNWARKHTTALQKEYDDRDP